MLAKTEIAKGGSVVTDGLSCWRTVETAGCCHWPMIIRSGLHTTHWAPFISVNTAPGIIKTALTGTYHHVTAAERLA